MEAKVENKKTETKGRVTREHSSRDIEKRPKKWTPPELMPSINMQPGYSYRWCRVSTMGQLDPKNVSSKFREGWEPVKASEHPEAFTMPDPNSRFEDSIEIGGLVLCKTDEELTMRRDQYYADRTRQNTESVDSNYMREDDPRMPLFKNKSTKVTFGTGGGK
tara:strand:- start:208 stop:693 length:486 start_codon:yes stop_codon:yes gene_type:complete